MNMKKFFMIVGITMLLGSVRYLLDAPSHLSASVAGAGLAIAASLCFFAAAVLRLAGDAPNLAPQRTRPNSARHDEAKVTPGGPIY